MALTLDPRAEAARDRAKRCVSEGGGLEMNVLLSALFHGSKLKDRFPRLERFLPEPAEQHKKTPESVPLAADLKPVLTELSARSGPPLTPEAWFFALLRSPEGREFARSVGMSPEEIDPVLEELGSELQDPVVPASGSPSRGEPHSPRGAGHASPVAKTEGGKEAREVASPGGWRESEERNQVVEALNSFGRMLTVGEPPQKGIVELERPLQSLFRALVKRKQRSAIVIGQPGTGKSALVYEFARLLTTRDPSVPERLRDYDIFELSPTFLRSGASYVGQYEERVGSLIKILTANPKLILFIDEVHSMFQSGIHQRGPFTDANEAFKQAIALGEVSLIGCTTTAEYRHHIEPDQALAQRFTTITIAPPSLEATKTILRSRRPGLEEFYDIEISDEMLDRTVQLTEEYLPGRAQPRKSIQLLDEACAHSMIQEPPTERLTEAELWQALEDTIGYSVAKREALSEDSVLQRLRGRIVGQDEVLSGIAKAFVSGLGGWSKTAGRPRGVFLFSGPTGVGKTETAVLLSQILRGGKEGLLRVDCNTLKGSGHDGGPAQNVLFGPPPGYIGYVRGKGGILSRIRDTPECIVLFDEIEKADPNVGELLFRIMDDGQCEDKDGNILDFRRSFIIFTTNAGAVYKRQQAIGFGSGSASEAGEPATDPDEMEAHFTRMGLGKPFLGRITHFFDFKGLDQESVQVILRSQLLSLEDMATERGFGLEWGEEVVSHLVAQWQPQFGVRHLVSILRNRVVEQLSVADAQGELVGVKTIRLEVLKPEAAGALGELTGLARRSRTNDTLLISLA